MKKEKDMLANGRTWRWRAAGLAALAVLGVSRVGRAQTFNSGSTGTDGALDLTGTPPGTVEFDPVARNIDPERDNIFHFTTITIPSGVRLKLTAKKLNGPVYWLASGAVSISGAIDLNGEQGHRYGPSTADRRPSIPGPGGYPGGVGGLPPFTALGAPQPGSGPGGGAPGVIGNWEGHGGSFSGTKYLVPLVGGSGGGGATNSGGDWWGSGGGAGGGAILIASSVSITVSGDVEAWGGWSGRDQNGNCNGVNGGGGSGGAIRLVAPLIQGSGTVEAGAGHSCRHNQHLSAGRGRVRLEAFRHNWSFRMRDQYTTYSTGSPLSSFVPSTPPPVVMVTSIGGVTVPPNSTGSFDMPDATINSSSPVEVQIQARGVPVGTIVKLYLFSLESADQTLDSTPLMGTVQSSSATATVTFPSGFSRGFVRAKW